MAFSPPHVDESESSVRRALRYAFHDWTREMPSSKRIATMTGIVLQGYAIWGLWSRSLAWPLMWPRGPSLYVCIGVMYMLGYWLMNAMLTSEFVRKTQLESDQIAARQIQQTLQPEKLHDLPGYDLETSYEPFREVGGDYFDVIELPNNRTLFALADVSGKGMPAALLAANIQALVRSIASVQVDLLALATQINRHLCRYTPRNRFATAIFVLLNRDSGELTYVNAGHNAPIVACSGSATFLKPTGIPLGLFAEAEYKTETAILGCGCALLLFTDGLTDSIAGDHPEDRLRNALADPSRTKVSDLKSLTSTKLNQDDVTILLLKRAAATRTTSPEPIGKEPTEYADNA